MIAQQFSGVVAASVAPVVVISASALLALALYNRLAAIVARLRAVQRERLQLKEQFDALAAEQIDEGAGLRLTCIMESLAHQSQRIRRRARLVRGSLLFLLAAIANLIISSLCNGLTVVWPSMLAGALLMFTIGMLCVLASVGCAMIELSSALGPAEMETDVVSELTGFLTTENQDERDPDRVIHN